MNADMSVKESTGRKALLLVGSAKPEGSSTSESLGGYLLDRLAEQGWQTETMLLHRALRTEARAQAMLETVDAADLVVLAFPVYVDTLPYLATEALERIAGESGRDHQPPASPSPRRGGGRGERSFLAIANCGFPEAQHCDVALEICRRFAREAGFSWAGGLALGAGGAINGRSLAQAGGMARNVIAALDAAADALARGEALSPEIEEQMRQPMMPRGLYRMAGNAGWLMTARRNGVLRRLGARPF
jgi:hypothetical protein